MVRWGFVVVDIVGGWEGGGGRGEGRYRKGWGEWGGEWVGNDVDDFGGEVDFGFFWGKMFFFNILFGENELILW